MSDCKFHRRILTTVDLANLRLEGRDMDTWLHKYFHQLAELYDKTNQLFGYLVPSSLRLPRARAKNLLPTPQECEEYAENILRSGTPTRTNNARTLPTPVQITPNGQNTPVHVPYHIRKAQAKSILRNMLGGN